MTEVCGTDMNRQMHRVLCRGGPLDGREIGVNIKTGPLQLLIGKVVHDYAVQDGVAMYEPVVLGED
jgi:hypothetical protein